MFVDWIVLMILIGVYLIKTRFLKWFASSNYMFVCKKSRSISNVSIIGVILGLNIILS